MSPSNDSKRDVSFPVMKNDLILRAARGEAGLERVPVWVMRQAGRYLPEFRELRAKEPDFFHICRTPELACEVTLQPIRRYSGLLDAAIIFSDILVVLQAIGLKVEMKTGHGPHLPEPLESPACLKRLSNDGSIESLKYVYDAITLTRHKLDGEVPLIGFTGAPWTLMSYAIEGSGSKTMSKAKKWLYTNKEASHELLNLLADVNIDYLVEQVKAGAQMLQIFESHAGHLTRDLFQEFCIPVLQRIGDEVKTKLREMNMEPVPMTIFAKDGHYALDLLSNISSYDVIGLDWTINPSDQLFRRNVGSSKVLQGNLDPCQLYANEDEIDRESERMCKRFGDCKWIANLGHGIYPDIDPDHLKVFLQAIHKYSKKKGSIQ